MGGPCFRLWLFGNVRAEYDGRPVRIVARPLCAVLLAMLTARPGVRFSRTELAAELWPDEQDPTRARGNLRRHLSALQAELPPVPGEGSWIEADAADVAWTRALPFWSDAAEFETLLTEPSAAPDAFAGAAHFMRGYTGDWVVAQRENYRARAVDRLVAMAVERQDDDRLDEALRCAETALQIDRFCEEAVCLAIELHGERGDPVAAGQLYADFADRLRRELDSQPAASTAAALERVRGAAGARRERLPRALTTFVGRGAAVDGVEAALEKHRCVTILGTGGAGKTRLSLETASRVAYRFVDGSYFIDLSVVPPDGSVIDATVRGLELTTELASAGSEGIKRFLRNRRALLILDNCEHLRDACAALVHDLLAAAPRLTVLASSRVALGTSEEVVYRLGALSVAEARALFLERGRSTGSTVARTQREIDAVDRICEALDRSPLAIELAAGLCGSLAVADIERRLTDRFAMLRSRDHNVPDRHRTLEATIAWGYDLLEPHERRLFARLAVFPASFTFDDAVEIGGEPAGTLLGLIEKSMVARDESDSERYRLLYSLAEFAQGLFAGSADAAATARRHADRYAKLALFPESPSYFRGELRWFEELDLELENIRAALRYLLSGPEADPPLGIRMCLALERYFGVRGYFAEGLAWLRAARDAAEPYGVGYALVRVRTGKLLMRQDAFRDAFVEVASGVDILRAAGDPADRARALTELGAISISLCKLEAAEELFAEAMTLVEGGGGTLETKATILANLGVIAMARRDQVAARARIAEAAVLFKREGDRRLLARMLGILGGLEFGAGRNAAARELLTEALDLTRTTGDVRQIADLLADSGDLLLVDGNVAQARDCFTEALDLAVRHGLSTSAEWALVGFAGIALAGGDANVAARLLGASKYYADEGFKTDISHSLFDRTKSAAVALLGEPAFECELLRGAVLDFEDALALALGVPALS